MSYCVRCLQPYSLCPDACDPTTSIFGSTSYTRHDAVRDLLAFADLTGIGKDGKETRRPGPRAGEKHWRYRLARDLMLALRGIHDPK